MLEPACNVSVVLQKFQRSKLKIVEVEQPLLFALVLIFNKHIYKPAGQLLQHLVNIPRAASFLFRLIDELDEGDRRVFLAPVLVFVVASVSILDDLANKSNLRINVQNG